MKLQIRQTEYYETYVVRDSIVIDTDDFPNLRGLTQEEAIEYIKNEDLTEAYPEEGSEWDTHYSQYKMSLSEIVGEQDIIKDKVYNDTYTVLVEDTETGKEL